MCELGHHQFCFPGQYRLLGIKEADKWCLNWYTNTVKWKSWYQNLFFLKWYSPLTSIFLLSPSLPLSSPPPSFQSSTACISSLRIRVRSGVLTTSDRMKRGQAELNPTETRTQRSRPDWSNTIQGPPRTPAPVSYPGNWSSSILPQVSWTHSYFRALMLWTSAIVIEQINWKTWTLVLKRTCYDYCPTHDIWLLILLLWYQWWKK